MVLFALFLNQTIALKRTDIKSTAYLKKKHLNDKAEIDGPTKHVLIVIAGLQNNYFCGVHNR